MRAPRRLPALLLAAVLGAASLAPAFAVQPDEILADPKLEGRARQLSAELRCLVCQNQSIDDSDAPLARDLRLVVRDKLKSGASDQEVRDFLVARYGEFVLLKPSFSGKNLILWLAPFAVLLAGGALVWTNARKRAVLAGASAPLTAEEQAELDKVLRKEG
ncbi:cytochrome c-type biogenesis protein [uncultured Alsobacter sp.]|uniref:cytochrome c-type biogenesis protein n=1 Tax=uncultured Alsobacter sp. TaxID=1748258 RepID=UPI0025D57F2D|nr:cytochrome c-type biogenesis protein [uncultured Alsobacter sp.]